MLRWPWSSRQSKTPRPDAEVPQPPIQARLDDNLQYIKQMFGAALDLRVREFTLQTPSLVRSAIIYLDSLTDSQSVITAVMQPLLLGSRLIDGLDTPRAQLLQVLDEALVAGGITQRIDDCKEAVRAILQGNVVLLVDGCRGGIAVQLPTKNSRSIGEPEVEQVLTGPRDGFVELLQTNLTLLRRRLRTETLRVENYTLGELTKTPVVLIYLDKIASPQVVDEARKRLSRIKVDSVLDTQHLEEFIEDAPFSLFPLWGSTERPDTCAAQLLEGSIGIMADGSPVCIFAPVTFFTFFQTPDDYYTYSPGATWARWLRLLGLLISTIAPALAVALINFHPEVIPFNLLISIAEGRERVPFPLAVEILVMDITFELLREAGLRMPRTIGQALSILGALVLGQAAIQAGLVGPHAILIVAITAITSFLVGRTKITFATRLLRFALLIAASVLGILGLVLALIAVVVHQVSLRSLGVPYMYPLAPLNLQGLKDVMVRLPRWAHPFRPAAYTWEQSQRLDPQQPGPPKSGGDS